ncbi:MAG: Gfo/Idh/MocA family oxidoreductase [Verrucomicrobiales bacterium]|nr:Gfo/Idh/MocA family oxidoreductase [Verrucomicrobiales bacterium]
MSLPANLLSRRRFLGRSALFAGGVLSAPALIPASALGRGGWRPPSERIQMGFIGLGGQGTGHLLGGAWTYVPGGYAARPDVQVVAVCDVRRERREHAQRRCNEIYAQRFGVASFNGVSAHNDFREVLARADVDAVLLALPYHWAAPMAVLAMRAGKDVYCEKPVAITVRESAVLVETARRFGRVYQAGTQQRSEYSGRFRIACELVRNGRIGRLKEVYAYRQPGAFFPTPWSAMESKPVPPGFDWDLWLGPLPWRPFNGEAGHALPGCFVGDVNWSPHHYDFIHWVVDPDPNVPVEIEYTPPAAGREAVIRYHLRDGVVIHSGAHPGERVGGEGGACFVGTEGRIAVDRSNLVAEPEHLLREPIRATDWRAYRSESHSGNFLECVRTRRPTICDAETAARAMNLILVGGIALVLKRSLVWDGRASAFIGDPEANRLLAYAPRPPWLI